MMKRTDGLVFFWSSEGGTRLHVRAFKQNTTRVLPLHELDDMGQAIFERMPFPVKGVGPTCVLYGTKHDGEGMLYASARYDHSSQEEDVPAKMTSAGFVPFDLGAHPW